MNEPLARIAGGAEWYLQDRMGSVRDIVDEDGDPVAHVTYDAWGLVTGSSGTTDRYLAFGYQLDAESGLYYVMARYMDPVTHLFVSQDPAYSDSNEYRYAGNSPTNATDPTGLTVVVSGEARAQLMRLLGDLNLGIPLFADSIGTGDGSAVIKIGYKEMHEAGKGTTARQEHNKYANALDRRIDEIKKDKDVSESLILLLDGLDSRDERVDVTLKDGKLMIGKRKLQQGELKQLIPLLVPSEQGWGKQADAQMAQRGLPVNGKPGAFEQRGQIMMPLIVKAYLQGMTSGVLDATPGVGQVKTSTEIICGKDLITGEKLSPEGRAISFVGLLVSLLPLGGLLKTEAKLAAKVEGTILKTEAKVAAKVEGCVLKAEAKASAAEAKAGATGVVVKELQMVKGPVCFVAGTPLLTPDGDAPIETLRPGDLVLSRADHDVEGPIEAKRIEEVFVRTGPVHELHVGGRIIRTTSEHPFWVRGKGWRSTKELRAGDELASHDGSWIAVSKVTDVVEVATVYNVRVADHHTYFVGSRAWGFSIWAHNAEYGIIRRGNAALLTDEAGNIVKTPQGDPIVFSEGNWEQSVAKAKQWIERQPSAKVGSVNARDQNIPDPNNNKPGMQRELWLREQELARQKASTMFGEKGVRTPSQTVWQKGKTERVDIENPNPGGRPGNLHYQDPNNVKYYYDPKTDSFPGSAAVTKKLQTDSEFREAVNKGLRALGEPEK